MTGSSSGEGTKVVDLSWSLTAQREGSPRTKSGKSAVLVLAAFAVLTSACGTRVSSAEERGSPVVASGTSGSTSPIQSPPSGAPTSLADPPTNSAGVAVAQTNKASSPSGQRVGASEARASVGLPAWAGRDVPKTAPGATQMQSTSGADGVPPPSDGPGQQRVPGGSPLILANVSTLSGPAGSGGLPIALGAQVWVKFVNARGGVGGRQVKLLVYDDGLDPSRRRAQLRDAVERQHAITFLANFEAGTGNCCVNYLEEKRVPVVGIEGGSPWAAKSPMYFPQGSNHDAMVYSSLFSLGDRMVPAGKARFGTLVCVEGQVCTDYERIATAFSEKVGLRHVYRGRASLAQPDFTAECLAAQNAGVQVLGLVFDEVSIRRIAASCARQGYRPVFTVLPPSVSDSYKDDPNLDGLVPTSHVFPYFETGTPAVDEFHQAMTAYGQAVPRGVGPAIAWVAGKLFEKAAANMPEPPTSEALLRGLWSIKNDDLNGLTMPLTFVEDHPAPQLACWFDLLIAHRAWTSPDGFKRHCRALPSG